MLSFDGRPRPDVQARSNAVGPGFVRTLGARIIAGQDLDAPEHVGRSNVVLINETLANRLVPSPAGEGPALWLTVLGREVRTEVGGGRIVGVIRDLVQTTPATPAVSELFQFDARSAFSVIAVRVSRLEETDLRAALEGIWGRFSPRQLTWLGDELDRVLAPYRSQAWLLGAIAACCLPISGIGLIGALTYSVQVRTREIALRIAVGADPGKLRRAIVRQSMVAVGTGVALGTAIGAALGSVVARQLFQVHPVDASTMIGVATGLALLAWLAAFLPARQAAAVDPALALREV